MDEYKYESLDDHLWFGDSSELKDEPELARKIRSNLEKERRQSSDENFVSLFIEYQLREIKGALDNDYFDWRYAELSTARREAEDSLKSDNMYWQLLAFSKLGEAIGKMNMPTELQLYELKRQTMVQEIREHERTAGLQKQNSERALLKKISQGIAKELWDKDLSKIIRVSDMTDKVYAETHKRFGDNPIYKYLPEKDAVKDWVREIAPDYAKRGGRPKKTKK